MAKKSSIWKRIRPTIKEGNQFKNEKNYKQAIQKYREAINYLEENIKNPKEIEADIGIIVSKIDAAYSAEINDSVEQTAILVENKKFDEAIKQLNDALNIGNQIKDSIKKNTEIKNIKELINKTELEAIIEQGLNEKEQKKFDKALEIFKKALNKANKIFSTKPEGVEITNIKDLINQTYSEKIKLITDKGDELKKNSKFDDAINIFEEAIKISQKMYDSEQKETEISNIEDIINQISSEKIKPILEKGQQLIEQNKFDDAIAELKNALTIANAMYESYKKKRNLDKIGELVNPISANKIKQIKEVGMELIQKENFEESVSIINEATETFKKALKIVNEMVESEEKDKEYEHITKLINETCLAGMKVRENKGIELIKQKEFDKAISEMYSALSIAKNMASEEDAEKETDKIKNLVNQVYISQIEVVLEKGKKLLEQNKYNKARETFDEAMQITNKMYLSEETEREINKIKNLMYQTEMKQVITSGYISKEQKKFEKELETLKEKLNRANLIKDTELKSKKISAIKHSIDKVYSNQIKLLIEYGNQLAKQTKFDMAINEINQTLKFIDLIEYTVVRDNQLVKIINAILEYGKSLTEKNKFETAFADFDKALDIAEKVSDKGLKSDQIAKIKLLYEQKLDNKAKQEIENGEFDNAINSCKKAIKLDSMFLESYRNMGNAYFYKENYDTAIEYQQKAVELDPNFVNAWNDMGLVYEYKGEYDNALRFINKAIEIDPDHAIAWYRMGNVYKEKKELKKAIECYEKAIDLDPDLSKAWLFMGYSYYDKKEYDKAIELLEKAIELDSNLKKELSPLIKKFKNLANSLQDKLSEIFYTT